MLFDMCGPLSLETIQILEIPQDHLNPPTASNPSYTLKKSFYNQFPAKLRQNQKTIFQTSLSKAFRQPELIAGLSNEDVNNCKNEATSFIERCISWHFEDRPTAEECLTTALFNS